MESTPIQVHFPLSGEWVAYNTPGDRVPSHGTDAYGQRFAYDFLRIDSERTGLNTCRSSPLRYYLGGLPLTDFYSWGEPVYAPFDSTVIASADGRRERSPVHYFGVRTTPAWDGLVSVVAGRRWDSWIAGNYVILKKRDQPVYAFFAHLKSGSVVVEVGQEVPVGQALGAVGHSGHSSEPHLHFQLMDRPDLRNAHGLPCSFVKYDELRDGSWRSVRDGIPERAHPIRSAS